MVLSAERDNILCVLFIVSEMMVALSAIRTLRDDALLWVLVRPERGGSGVALLALLPDHDALGGFRLTITRPPDVLAFTVLHRIRASAASAVGIPILFASGAYPERFKGQHLLALRAPLLVLPDIGRFIDFHSSESRSDNLSPDWQGLWCAVRFEVPLAPRTLYRAPGYVL